MTLEELASREMWLLDQVGQAVGSMEEKLARLHADGVFAESARIHAAYVELAGPPTDSREALKRAVFLGWYEQVEPACFTGVRDLNPAATRRALELMDSAVADGSVDEEFAAMLGWYWTLADWYFGSHASDRVQQYLSGLDADAHLALGLPRAALEGRGQMGAYWASVTDRAT